MADVVTIGNALVDAFLTIHDENVHARINAADGELCIRSGEKVWWSESPQTESGVETQYFEQIFEIDKRHNLHQAVLQATTQR